MNPTEDQTARIGRRATNQLPLGIGVIGCGYWGPHLIRNLHGLADAELLAVADVRPDRLECVGRNYPTVDLFSDHEQLLKTAAEALRWSRMLGSRGLFAQFFFRLSSGTAGSRSTS